MKKTIEDVQKMTQTVADFHGWELNQKTRFLERLRQGLLTNFNRYGYFLCPCRDTEGSREADQDVICPCEYAQPDIDEFERCYCGLYFCKDARQEQLPVGSIPERRYQED